MGGVLFSNPKFSITDESSNVGKKIVAISQWGNGSQPEGAKIPEHDKLKVAVVKLSPQIFHNFMTSK